MSRVNFDPVRLEILWGGLVSICEEMGVALKRTAYSEMVREANDFSSALFDREGNLLAQTDLNGSPGHLGSIRDVLRIMFREFPPSQLKDGDTLLTNDPYIASGHLPDIAMATPIFRDQELIAFAVNITHHTDVGGKGAGGHIADARQIFEEGIRIPVSKLYDKGKPNEELIRIFKANVRMPDREMGDIRAQLSSNYVGMRRIMEFMKDHRLDNDGFDALAKAVVNTTERTTREDIEKTPRGIYHAKEFMEDFEGSGRIKLQVSIEVKNRGMKIDYAGTGPQSEYGINSVYNYTFAYTSHAIKCLLNPKMPMNEGFMKPLDVNVPEGSVLNAKFPAAVGARHLTNWRVNSLIFRALAKALPDRVTAASGGTGSAMPQFLGFDQRKNRAFVQIHNHSGGQGARPNKDGLHCYPFPARAENTPVETLEHAAPIMVERIELLQDSGGPGKHRGGCGISVDFRMLAKDNSVLGTLAGRDVYPAQGIFGGRPGSKAAIILNPGKHERVIHPRRLAILKPNDVVRFMLPGGGGYGYPWQRDIQLVLEDVHSGLVSIKSAKQDYGVVIDRINLTVNLAKTKRLRALMKRKATIQPD